MLSGNSNAFSNISLILVLIGKMLLEWGTLLPFSTMWLQHMYALLLIFYTVN